MFSIKYLPYASFILPTVFAQVNQICHKIYADIIFYGLWKKDGILFTVERIKLHMYMI